jgi:hypothetical protein
MKGLACKKTINCTNIIKLINIVIYLYKIRCEFKNKIRNLSSELRRGSRNVVIRVSMRMAMSIALAEIVIIELLTTKTCCSAGTASVYKELK